MKQYYKMKVAGCDRELPLCPVNEHLDIAAFIMFGDIEVTEKAAKLLLEKCPEHDVLVTAEAKGIPLCYEMARQVKKIQGKRVLIVDDVISTGESLNALMQLVEKAGGNIVGMAAVLAEGDAQERDDIVYLDALPLFVKK